MDLHADTPVQYIPRVGPAMASRLTRLGIATALDLLYHLPHRYNDFSLISPIARLKTGETVTVTASVDSMRTFMTKNGKKIQQAVIRDATGTITATWFNQPYLRSVILEGETYNFSGAVTWFGKTIVLMSPEYERIEGSVGQTLNTGRLVSVYPETEGVSSKWLRGRILFALDQLERELTDRLPPETLSANRLWSLGDALRQVHFPDSLENARSARHRLAFEELFFLHLRSRQIRRVWETTKKAPTLRITRVERTVFTEKLPFTLTSDQVKAMTELAADLERPYPMNRLLVGDVGSGKTVVASFAMYIAAKNGYSSVLMAPTQILAQQHYETISRLFPAFPVPIHLVTAETSNPVRRQEESLFGNQAPGCFIGTHALLSERVSLPNVGLTIIDEQHRFGVDQRMRLRERGAARSEPHLLTMTATPIPRTVALTFYGNLDLSVLNELPEDRKPVKTWVVPKEKRVSAYTWIAREINAHRTQAFIVCPLIAESETLTTVASATHEYERLRTQVFPNLRLSLLHGRMKAAQKTWVLSGFRRHDIDILVATPVVEVGIDIPNATVMMIEASERFGLAQLHQLRGRVGRSHRQSYCLLFTETADDESLDRLKSLETHFSGPELAEIDLALRGPGELFGTKQHGVPILKAASLTDMNLIEKTGKAALLITQKDPDLTGFPLLRESLRRGTIESVSQD